MRLSGGDLIARTLREAGVDTLFTLCGGHISPILNGCVDAGIRIIDMRHESGAAMAADAYARTTRRIGVCAVTAGPGFTNCLTGVASAYMTGSPVVIVAGASNHMHSGKGDLQEIDQVAMARPITKWAASVDDPGRVGEYVARAIQVAESGVPGPVLLSVGMDINWAWTSGTGGTPRQVLAARRPVPEPGVVAAAFERLRKASRPIILVGSEAYWNTEPEDLIALAERLGVPILTQELARGLVPDTHPVCVGEADPRANGAAAMLNQADVLLLLGLTFDYRLGFGGPSVVAPEAAVIQVSQDGSRLGRNRAVELGVTADPGEFVRALAQGAKGDRLNHGAWLAELQAARKAKLAGWNAHRSADDAPVNPLRAASEIRPFVTDDAVLVLDGGDVKYWAKVEIPAVKPGCAIELGAFGAIGSGLPFALGVKAARPAARVVHITGDGSFGLTGFEMESAVRHKLPVISAVFNDRGWGMTRHGQRALYGADRTHGTELAPTRYDQIAAAMGAHGEGVERPAEIAPAMARALAAGRPAVINISTSSIISPGTEHTLQMKRAMFDAR